METKPINESSLVALFRELRDEMTMLVRQEVALARVEITEKLSRITRNAVQVAIGALLAYAALVIVLLGIRDVIAVALVNNGASETVAALVSALVVGAVVGIIGGILIAKGKKALAKDRLTPTETVDSLRENKDWAKQRLQQT